jgi:hypothetical protein
MPPVTGIPSFEKLSIGNRPDYFEEFERWNTLRQASLSAGSLKNQGARRAAPLRSARRCQTSGATK